MLCAEHISWFESNFQDFPLFSAGNRINSEEIRARTQFHFTAAVAAAAAVTAASDDDDSMARKSLFFFRSAKYDSFFIVSFYDYII